MSIVYAYFEFLLAFQCFYTCRRLNNYLNMSSTTTSRKVGQVAISSDHLDTSETSYSCLTMQVLSHIRECPKLGYLLYNYAIQ